MAARLKKGTKNINPKDMIGITKVPLHFVSPVAQVLGASAAYLGNVKYGAWNYRGSPIRASVYYSALQRHMVSWWSGEEFDADGTHHFANALACIAILAEGHYLGNLVDDRPPAVNIRPLMKEVERQMQAINKMYGHMKPKHWTIADKAYVPKGKRRAKAKA